MVSGITISAFEPVDIVHTHMLVGPYWVPHRFVDHVDRLDVVAAVGAYTCGDQCSMVQ
jgi:hypothetical protein